MNEAQARKWIDQGVDEKWPDDVFIEIVAAHAELLYESVHHRRLRPIVESLAPGAAVLDAGCSTGIMCDLAARSGARFVMGLDIDPERVRKAELRMTGLKVPYRLATADLQEQWPVEAGSFDVVLSSEVVEHLRPEAQERFVGEAARALLPGGTLLITTPNAECWFSKTEEPTGEWSPHDHSGEMSGARLAVLYERAGFEARVRYYRYPKVNKVLRLRGLDRLADLVERIPPRRRLAMGLLGQGTKRQG